MGTIFFAYNALAQRVVTLNAGNELATAPATNLFLRHPSDVWQSSDLTNLFFEVELAAGDTWDVLSLLYTNGELGDQWRIRTATSQVNLTASPTSDTGQVAMFGSAVWAQSLVRPALHVAPVVRSDSWLRIDITSSSSLGYWRAGNLIIANKIAPARNFQRDLRIGPPALIQMRYLATTDLMTLQDASIANEDDPVFVVFDPDEPTYLHNSVVWGLDRRNESPILTSVDLWSKRYTVQPFI